LPPGQTDWQTDWQTARCRPARITASQLTPSPIGRRDNFAHFGDLNSIATTILEIIPESLERFDLLYALIFEAVLFRKMERSMKPDQAVAFVDTGNFPRIDEYFQWVPFVFL
jgi:hypothetical protein